MTTWIQSTPTSQLQTKTLTGVHATTSADLQLTGKTLQALRGFGGCFNELGYLPLNQLKADQQEDILKDLFSPDGLNFTFNRTPIGANDFAETWYSYDETAGDYQLKHFSVDHDKQTLIPYIKRAQKYQPNLQLFASPWTPPTWMKFPKVYNFGRIVMTPENLQAYADYFVKYLQAYEEQGIHVQRVCPQNEVFADQKFPSCLWSSDDLRTFIRDYLGPTLEKSGLDTDIFLGTLNGPEDTSFSPTGMKLDNYNRYVDNILFDGDARKYIKGIGYQWAGQHAIERTHASWPEIELIQTESECGMGDNSWSYAEYIFHLVNHYFTAGATAYTYWNIILGDSISTWGWHQNSLFSIDSKTQEVTRNPEYYVMRHYAHYVKPGAHVLATTGHFNSMGKAFRNPDGQLVVVVQNALERELPFTFADPENPDKGVQATLAPNSFNTFVID
ncbi:glycoside hydrolase family 30 protein [Levilactobacillus spicheri]|uniref:Glycosyl hydrolase n=2 Tax=Levilactobacillus spicheri TaxID=216463 RepID=A0ABQ0WMX5_9LACO|nr:glycoside hydrolase family 30 protein [Levilactobacillus spicheri]KRL48777.1 glycosyl hydrolase, 30 family [Levilactobacillus spicheri DSM 15429]GEO66361.1 glycosyl hydrolase [Levilactobacillus spicheri]